MRSKRIQCKDCDKKYEDKEKHYAKYHKDFMANQVPIIPFEYYADIRYLLKHSKLQVVKQRPQLMVRVSPFIHQPVEIGDDITFEIGKTYIVKERE